MCRVGATRCLAAIFVPIFDGYRQLMCMHDSRHVEGSGGMGEGLVSGNRFPSIRNNALKSCLPIAEHC